jgi:hypothetical protein
MGVFTKCRERKTGRLFLTPHFLPRFFFLELQEVVNDCQRVVLKLGVQFIKEADYPFPLFHRGALEDFTLAGLEPFFIHPEGQADKPEDAVIGDPVPVLNFRRIAVANADGSGKVRLGHIEGLSDLPDPLIDRHIMDYTRFFHT